MNNAVFLKIQLSTVNDSELPHNSQNDICLSKLTGIMMQPAEKLTEREESF